MADIDIREQASQIIDQLVNTSYSQIFDISPLERDLNVMHMNNPNIAEPLIGMMFCSIMLGNKPLAIEYGNKIWHLHQELEDEIEMLYADCLINVGLFEKAQNLISEKMNDVKKNIELYYTTVVKYALYTGDLYILNNLAQYPQIYNADPLLFDFAEKYYTGINNKHYNAILKIINDTVGNAICTTEYSVLEDNHIELNLYTSTNTEENIKNQTLIADKINSYYLSMQEQNNNDISVTIENINLHTEWW